MLAHCPELPHGLRRDRALTGLTDVEGLAVVYVGRKAALLATRSGALVPVTAGPACLVPGGFGAPDLAPFLARWSGLADGVVVDLRAWHAAAAAVDLRIPVAARAIPRVAGLDRGLSDGPAGSAGFAADCATTRAQVAELDGVLPGGSSREGRRAEELARLALDAGDLAACVAATVGAGPGSTPAGDDVICGVFAGLDLLGLGAAHQRLGAAVTPLLSATTRSSRHLLAAAAAGRYTERLIGLAAALASGRSVRAALDALARWGASSGLDQATGFAAAIRAGSVVGAGAR